MTTLKQELRGASEDFALGILCDYAKGETPQTAELWPAYMRSKIIEAVIEHAGSSAEDAIVRDPYAKARLAYAEWRQTTPVERLRTQHWCDTIEDVKEKVEDGLDIVDG